MSLIVHELCVSIGGRQVVSGVSFEVSDGERVGIIGESGSGKSLTALAILGLLPAEAEVGGSILFNGRELVGCSDRELAAIRGDQIGIVFQEPQTALSPLIRLGKQMTESLRIHYTLSRTQAKDAAVELARRVGLPDPESIVRSYPHEVSGGQRQRAAIAAAIAAGPELLIADEPTTALDVTVQKGVLELFRELSDETGSSLVFITHDLAVLKQIADRMIVLDDGAVVESGTVDAVLSNPQHPSTRALVAAALATSWRRPAVGE
ncbi:ABC transporter ATP-binding protein [Lysinibacter cavernae]|uniref:Peptide/nickel transport system ATP-binding protein n=1 Tax=Lysinibacter cavernae TaxID=1640652 RepID=A0A7X5R3I2_9MICO|nr:ABC transporter ATP-binding protein [Lysinibacter cavernae]NIH54964.1 peptide/nickel transport system ATP-binding protein [Lysinibacter cavernae]